MKKPYTNRKAITLNEICILVFLLVGALIWIFFSSKPSDEDFSAATLFLDGEVYEVFELDENSVYTIAELAVEIEVLDGKIRFLENDCSDKTCVKMGFIDSPSEVAVCLPKKLVLKITAKDDDEIDIVLK